MRERRWLNFSASYLRVGAIGPQSECVGRVILCRLSNCQQLRRRFDNRKISWSLRDTGKATTLEVRGGERSDRFHVGGVRDQLPLRRHTLVQRAKGGIALARSLSLGLNSTRLQVEPPPLSSWRDILRRSMRDDPAESVGPSRYGIPCRAQRSLSEAVLR